MIQRKATVVARVDVFCSENFVRSKPTGNNCFTNGECMNKGT